MNDYYDVNLKHTRLEHLEPYEKFTFIQGDISDKDSLMGIFEEYKPHVVVNLAAQAGVRYSIENPDCIYPKQHHWILQHPRGLQTPFSRPSCLCIFQLCLRSE